MGFVVAPLAAAIGVDAAGLSTGLGLVGAGVSAIGAISQGNAESAQASYEAQVARNNAITAGQNANYATAAGEQRAFNQALKERQQSQAVVSGLAASGIDINTGSAADVRTSQAAIGQQDVETVRQQAALTAYGYRTQATNYTAQATLDTAQAGFDTEAGWLKGLGGILTGAAKFGDFGGGGSGGGGGGGNNLSFNT